MRITPDLSEVNVNLEPGTYNARITGFEDATGQYGPQVKMSFEVFGSDKKGINGQTVSDYIGWTGKSAWKFTNLYQATMKQEYKPGTEVDMEMFNGKEVQLTLAEGKPQADGSPSRFPKVVKITGV